MKTTIGNYASYIYIRPNDKIVNTYELDSHVIIDENERGEIVGIEILSKLEPEYQKDVTYKIRDLI